MQIYSELLDLLKAHKKGIHRAAVNSFGKSLGPQEVLSALNKFAGAGMTESSVQYCRYHHRCGNLQTIRLHEQIGANIALPSLTPLLVALRLYPSCSSGYQDFAVAMPEGAPSCLLSNTSH
jgi:hypothetical protein